MSSYVKEHVTNLSKSDRDFCKFLAGLNSVKTYGETYAPS